MATVAVPSSTRDQAEAVIARHLGRQFSHETRLEGLGTVAAVQLLLALELNFDVLLDVDEVLPDGTLGGLVGLVTQKLREQPPRNPTPPCTLIDLAARRAERARRAREADAPPARRPPAGLSPVALAPVALPPQPVEFPRIDPSVRMALAMAAVCALGGALAGLATFLRHL